MDIALLAYEGISPFMLSTPQVVFADSGQGAHRVTLCAATPRLSVLGGLKMAGFAPLERALAADVVILPSWRQAEEPVDEALVDTLAQAHATGALVVGLCLGAFGLAQAGLLDGKRATTHWARMDPFAARFPKVTLDRHALFVDEGRVVTSAGMAAALDCCLHLMARLSGMTAANAVARQLLLAPQRSGTQPQLLDRPAPARGAETRVADLLDAIWADPRATPTLDALARAAGTSRRSLSRHIRARTGDTLSAWLRRARLARAQDLFLGGAKGHARVAEQSGFPDAAALRAAFRAEWGLTPSQWLSRQRVG